MRLLILTVPLLVLPFLAQAAEPSLAVRSARIGSITEPECMERARTAFTASGFRLAEASQTLQIAVSGDYVASAACVQGQSAMIVINVAGPRQADAEQLANSVRDTALNPGRAAAPQKPPR